MGCRPVAFTPGYVDLPTTRQFVLTDFTELEAMLIMTGAVDPPDRPLTGDRRGDDDDSEGEDDDISSRMRSKVTRTNARTAKNIRSSKDDSDSDFEFDM